LLTVDRHTPENHWLSPAAAAAPTYLGPQVFPHEYARAMKEASAVKKAEDAEKAAIKAAGVFGCVWLRFRVCVWLVLVVCVWFLGRRSHALCFLLPSAHAPLTHPLHINPHSPPPPPPGLEGVDAFERLKAEAAKASVAHPPKALQLPQPAMPDPAVARAALEVAAREGLPVKVCVWGGCLCVRARVHARVCLFICSVERRG
jgi:hypothetical protein